MLKKLTKRKGIVYEDFKKMRQPHNYKGGKNKWKMFCIPLLKQQNY